MSRTRKRRARGNAVGGGQTPAAARRTVSSPVRRAIVALVALKIFGIILIFDPGSAHAFEGPKSSFSLATAFLLAGLIAVDVLRNGLRVNLRSRLHLIAGAVMLAFVVATLFAEDPYIATFGAQRRLGLTYLFDLIVLYVAVGLAFRTLRDWGIFAAAIGGVGLVAMAYGLVQYTGLDPVPWFESTRQRPPSTFGNPDKFGHFLGFTFSAAVGLAIVPRTPRAVRMAAATYALITLGCAVLVATRGTLLAIAVALPAIGVIYLRLVGYRPSSRAVVAVGGLVIAAGLAAAAVVLVSPLGERVRGGFADPGTRQRVYVADAAFRAFGDRPLVGHGPDNFGVIYGRYRPAGSVAAGGLVHQDSAHSLPLQTLATTGLFGALSLGALALTSMWILWGRLRGSPHVGVPLLAGAAAYWIQSLVAIGSISVDWAGWVAAGGAASLSATVSVQAPRRTPFVLQPLAIGVALVLAVSGYSAFQADRELYASRVAQQARRPDRAIPAAERAVQLDAGRADNWAALGIARQDRGLTAQAAQAFQMATDRAPYVAAYWSSLAINLTNLVLAGDNSLGGKDAALVAARRGTEVDPNFPTPHHVRAVISNALGDYAGALRSSAAAIALYKGDAEYEATAADAALKHPDPASARRALEAIALEKDSAVVRVALARLSLKLNDPSSAREHVRRALELEPQNAAARELAPQVGIP